jgi:hypothetical protein
MAITTRKRALPRYNHQLSLYSAEFIKMNIGIQKAIAEIIPHLI